MTKSYCLSLLWASCKIAPKIAHCRMTRWKITFDRIRSASAGVWLKWRGLSGCQFGVWNFGIWIWHHFDASSNHLVFLIKGSRLGPAALSHSYPLSLSLTSMGGKSKKDVKEKSRDRSKTRGKGKSDKKSRSTKKREKSSSSCHESSTDDAEVQLCHAIASTFGLILDSNKLQDLDNCTL